MVQFASNEDEPKGMHRTFRTFEKRDRLRCILYGERKELPR